MRLSELSRAAGVTPATVKWYLRTGLLHRGEATAANQAQYDGSHLQRLRLIRALVEVGGLSTETVREVLTAVDDPDIPVLDVLAAAHDSAGRPPRAPTGADDLVEVFLRHRGWTVKPGSPARQQLAAVLDALATVADAGRTAQIGHPGQPEVADAEAVIALLQPYADAVEPLARAEIANAPVELSRAQLAERAAVGTVLMEQALTALRRLAQEHFAAQRYGRT